MTSARATRPARVQWAVDVLDPQPDEHVLEVGGGPGISAATICERLTSGRLHAVDRSPVAVQRTAARNAEHVATGRLVVEQCALRDLAVPQAAFDKALALDVNLFWTSAAAPEVAVLRRALRPGGVLHVLYGTASPTAADRIVPAVCAALRAGGFTAHSVVAAPAGTGVTARVPEARC